MDAVERTTSGLIGMTRKVSRCPDTQTRAGGQREDDDEVREPEESAGPAGYPCKQCGMVFLENGVLEGHVQSSHKTTSAAGDMASHFSSSSQSNSARQVTEDPNTPSSQTLSPRSSLTMSIEESTTPSSATMTPQSSTTMLTIDEKIAPSSITIISNPFVATIQSSSTVVDSKRSMTANSPPVSFTTITPQLSSSTQSKSITAVSRKPTKAPTALSSTAMASQLPSSFSQSASTTKGSGPVVDVTSSQPSFSSTHSKSSSSSGKEPKLTTKSLIDRENRAVAQLLTRFKNIIDLAPEPKPASQTTAAVQSYQIEVETAALVRSAEDLLSLTRLIKEMYVFGPLRAPGEGDDEVEMVQDAQAVQGMIDSLVEKTDKKPEKTIKMEQ